MTSAADALPQSRWRGLIGDIALTVALILFVVDLPDASGKDPRNIAVVAIVFSVLACFSLLARRWWPLIVLAITVVGSSVAVLTANGRNAASATCIVALYTVATRRSRRVAEAAGVVAALSLFVSTLFVWHEDRASSIVGPIAVYAAAVAIGEAIGSRRAYLIAVEERARRAEETREEEARRRVVEERMHIARELHDVVAHHIAVISAQAGSASQLLISDPDGAAQALTHVRQASRSVLEELAGMLNLLRRSDEANSAAPAPDLSELPMLLQSFASTGLVTTTQIQSSPIDLPQTTGLVAYRVVQEGLTNAHKHGDGRVQLEIRYSDKTLAIHLSNAPVLNGAANKSGYGITGMKERAAAVHGNATTGLEADGLFHVRVNLPLETETL